MRILVSSLLCAASAACYRYESATSVQPTAGHDVRVTLSSDAKQQLTPLLGPRTQSLTGRILDAGDQEFSFAVDRTFKDDGIIVVWAGERVSIPRTGIARTELRVLDRRKTFLVTGATIVGAIATGLILAQLSTNGNTTGPPPPPPPPP